MFVAVLEKAPADQASVELEVRYPATTKSGTKHSKMVRLMTLPASSVYQSGSQYRARFDYAKIGECLTASESRGRGPLPSRCRT